MVEIPLYIVLFSGGYMCVITVFALGSLPSLCVHILSRCARIVCAAFVRLFRKKPDLDDAPLVQAS